MDDRTNSILKLRNHLPTAVVRGWVRREENQSVDVEADRKPANLDVPFLENIKHAHLHQFVQFRELVHGEDAAMHARNQPEMKRRFS